jgi:hypothetical protein
VSVRRARFLPALRVFVLRSFGVLALAHDLREHELQPFAQLSHVNDPDQLFGRALVVSTIASIDVRVIG